MRTPTGSTVLPSSLRERLRRLVQDNGERATRERIGVARYTLERALAGLPIRVGSAALISGAVRSDNGR